MAVELETSIKLKHKKLKTLIARSEQELLIDEKIKAKQEQRDPRPIAELI